MNSIIETLKSNTTLLAINLFASCLFAFILFRFDGVLGEDLFFHLKISELITNNGFGLASTSGLTLIPSTERRKQKRKEKTRISKKSKHHKR